ncbi:MAG: DUF1631 domain-containing protein [Rhodoferax sp.]|nr:DUF1631 domain-containing protein [Rhodoferax sp.]
MATSPPVPVPTTPPTVSPRLQFARALRERFLAELGKTMTGIGDSVYERFTQLMDEPSTARETQERRDNWTAYKKCRPIWQDATLKAWRTCLEPLKKKAAVQFDEDGLQLVSADAVESKIQVSRMVMAVREKVHAQLDDLRIRMLHLEGMDELADNDIFHPEVLISALVEQWTNSGMSGASWSSATDVVQKILTERLQAAYSETNDTLIKKGVLPTIEPKDRRAKAPAARASGAAAARPPNAPPPVDTAKKPAEAASDSSAHGDLGAADGPAPPPRPAGGFFGARWGARAPAEPGPATQSAAGPSSMQPPSTSATPFWRQTSVSGQNYGSGGAASEETRMMTAMTPLMRARSRAQGVISQIKRLFSSQGADDSVNVSEQLQAPSAALAAALAPPPRGQDGEFAPGGTRYEDYSPAGVARVAGDLRQQTVELKQKAETKGEKATIEIVALMFQAILAEERIPPAIRVWFARLQMPVLRMALEDPDFLGTSTHPARLLIDRMGSCVMGFDTAGVQAKAMEMEIKRIVQVIEQYPETGKKVYQVVYEEFQKFLSKHLTDDSSTQRVVSVAQQVEQKETLAIQYTIEMRNMLKDMPVREEIRDFLFKVWAEVLAVAAVRKGPQDRDTIALKKSAADLVWAASAKPNRADRARVIQDLPDLLHRLRSGMALLGMPPSEQDVHIKAISDTLADAFLSKTQTIAQSSIDALAERLGHLEDFVSEDGVGDLPLDAESIEMMLGIDASNIEVVANGSSRPTAAMMAWAQELQIGSWFSLDHNHQVSQVQFAWRSDRKHLNLFAATTGKNFLIQAGRLAAYLQAGLLLPQEEETLTVRATRDALTKIEANPERLLA